MKTKLVNANANADVSTTTATSTSTSTRISAELTDSEELLLVAPDSTANEPTDITPIGEALQRKDLKNFKFPKNSTGRSFQLRWLNSFDWIEYSVVCDAVFCYPCRNYSIAKSSTRDEFVGIGFNVWSKALASNRGFKRHASSAAHIGAVASWQSRIHADENSNTVHIQLNAKFVEKRRYYMEAVIDVVNFLCKNELALRGDWDKLNQHETGLFNGLFDFTLNRDAKLRECEKAMPPNVNYRSPQIQNEVIELWSTALTERIADEVNQAPFSTLMLDGTKDKNGCEIMSIAMRYVLNGVPKEKLVGLEKCVDLSAKAITKVVLDALRSYGIDESKIISQCYDGASVMKGDGKIGGVQKHIQHELGRAIPFVHCFNHRLHLVLCGAISNNEYAKDFFEECRMIHDFFSRFKFKAFYDGKAIARLIPTRWDGHLKSTESIFANYHELVSTLTTLLKTHKKVSRLDATDLALADGILRAINKPKFVFMLVVMKDLLQLIEPVDKLLQARSTGYRDALPLIQTVLDLITAKRTNDEFEKYIDQSVTLLGEPISEPRPIRNRRRSSMLSNCVVMETIGERNGENEKTLLKAAYFEIIDNISSEIQRRFNDNSDILLALSSAEEFDLKKLKPLESCGVTLPTVAHFIVAEEYAKKHRKEGSSILQTILPIKDVIPDVYDLFAAIDTFACSTAVCEAGFSALKRVDVVQRLSMTNERLRQLSFIAFESKTLNEISNGEILERFARSKNRRVQMI